MSTENDVIIEFQGREEIFDIEDLDPDDLRQVFGLSFTPLSVKHKTSLRNIKIEKKEKFIPGKSKNGVSHIKVEFTSHPYKCIFCTALNSGITYVC